MPFIKLDPLNEAGHEILRLYQIYHRTFKKEEREKIFEEVESKIKNNPSVKEAFLGRFEGDLWFALCQTAYFASDARIVKELEKPVTEYLLSHNVDGFELYPYRERGQRKSGLICIERRIGIKASELEKTNGFPMSDARAFFRDGHAKAFLFYIVIPSLQQLLISESQEEAKVSILFSTERTRSYLENIKIQFIVSFDIITKDSKALDYIISRIQKVDEYKSQHPLLF